MKNKKNNLTQIRKKIFKAKEEFHREQANLPIEEKIEILVKLQEIAAHANPNSPGIVWHKKKASRSKSALIILAAIISLMLLACNPVKLIVPKPEGKVVVEKNISVPMKDGARLVGDLYHPLGDGPWPVIVNRLPYGVASVDPLVRVFAGAGYAVFAQDVRGRYRSEGGGKIFMPFVSDESDGRQTIEWVKKQKWCNGKIGTWGGSYHGYTQWCVAADNPDLSAMEPLITAADLYGFHYIGGALRLQMMLGWGMANMGRKSRQFSLVSRRRFMHLPVIDADNSIKGQWPWWDMVVSHPVKDDFWKRFDYSTGIDRVSAPALFVSGWYDILNTSLMRDFEKWQARGPDAPKAKLIVGPWNHVFYNTNLKNVDWSWKDAKEKVLVQNRLWFDRWLRDKRNGVDEGKPVNIFVMGENRWRELDEWPPKNAKPLSMYLHSDGKVSVSQSSGKISAAPPTDEEPFDAFDYDPQNPAPTKGGPGLAPWEAGPAKQNKFEQRPDVLVYSTPMLDAPITVIGPVSVKLFAATSAVDTDFTAKLIDVYPGGNAIIVSEGILRGRYMDGGEAKLLTPGKVYEWNLDLGYTALMFKPGHRLRLEISSSNFPRFDRNLNTGESQATGTRIIVAHQKVYHSSQFASRLILSTVEK